jgi:hypothetical protein
MGDSMKRAMLVGVAALVLLAACGPDSGTVTERKYVRGYTTMSRSCHKSGRARSCTNRPVRHRACWEIRFRDPNGRTGKDCVTEARYARIKVGDHYQK